MTVPSISSRLPTIIYPLLPAGIQRVERRKFYLFVQLSYTLPVSLRLALAWFLPSPRLCAYHSSFCFPVPVSHVLFRPCLDCAHHTPLFSYFTSTGCFHRACCLTCVWFVLSLTSFLLIRVFIVVPRIPRRIQPAPSVPPTFIPFGCLPFHFEFCCAYSRFFCLLPL